MEGIVVSSSVAINRLFYYPLHPRHQLLVSSVLQKTTGERLSIVLMKTFHVLAMRHYLHPLHYLTLVVSDKLQSKKEHVLKVQENVRIDTFHEVEVVFSELKGGSF